MTEYIPAKGEFVFVLDGVGNIFFPGKVVTVDHAAGMAGVRPVGEDVDPYDIPFNCIERHPLSTQRNVPEET